MASRSSARNSTSCSLVCEAVFFDLVEAGGQSLDAVAGDLGVVLELARQPLAFAAHRLVEFGDLGFEFLDARMLIEQRGRLLGQLRAQDHALFAQAADRFAIGDVGGVDRLARLDERAQLHRPRLAGRPAGRAPRRSAN